MLHTLASLDGAAGDPSRYFPETGTRPARPGSTSSLLTLEADRVARQDAVLLGRRRYDEWSRYWPYLG